MTVIYVLNFFAQSVLKVTQIWQKVVHTGLRKDNDNEYLLREGLSLQKNTMRSYYFHNLPSKVFIKPNRTILAFRLDSLFRRRFKYMIFHIYSIAFFTFYG